MKNIALAMFSICCAGAVNAQFGNTLGNFEKFYEGIQNSTKQQSQSRQLIVVAQINPTLSELPSKTAVIYKEDAIMDERLKQIAINPESYKVFFNRLKNAINTNDKIELSRMISYPLKTQRRLIRSSSELIDFYDWVFWETVTGDSGES